MTQVKNFRIKIKIKNGKINYFFI